MNTEKQRIAIAEACGWTQGYCPCGDEECGAWQSPRKDNWEYLPDYLNDLNAMHEAEKVMKGQKIDAYVTMLCLKVQSTPSLWNATAAQRAEAFLRTIGKWEDEA